MDDGSDRNPSTSARKTLHVLPTSASDAQQPSWASLGRCCTGLGCPADLLESQSRRVNETGPLSAAESVSREELFEGRLRQKNSSVEGCRTALQYLPVNRSPVVARAASAVMHRAGESPIPGVFQKVRVLERLEQDPCCRWIDVQDPCDFTRREGELGHVQLLRPEEFQCVLDATGFHRDLLSGGCSDHATPIRSILQETFGARHPSHNTVVIQPALSPQ